MAKPFGRTEIHLAMIENFDRCSSMAKRVRDSAVNSTIVSGASENDGKNQTEADFISFRQPVRSTIAVKAENRSDRGRRGGLARANQVRFE